MPDELIIVPGTNHWPGHEFISSVRIYSVEERLYRNLLDSNGQFNGFLGFAMAHIWEMTS
ncbi:MAG: hypothetical protein NDI73_09650 [Desulfuromonadales bacterium]|nr:hypothetical protein [Desulfuromonadales bacterium]